MQVKSLQNRHFPESRRMAFLFLGVVIGLATFLASIAIKQPIGAPRRSGPGDVELYQTIVQRVRSGERYYAALADELPKRGYPTASLFNWRTPLPMWLIGVLPPGVAKGGLLIAAALAVLLGYQAMHGEVGWPAAVFCAWLMVGALLPCALGNLFVMPVVWSGTFIFLSIALFASKHKHAAIVAGIAALFFRDLAFVYVMGSILVAAYERRWSELVGWATGLVAWLVFFVIHALLVLPHISADSVAHESSWVQFGGAAFLVGICQMNIFLLIRPAWLASLYLVAVLLGGFGWNTPWGRRVAWITLMYLLTFAVVGQPFNQYWGSLVAPLFCIPAARFPGMLASTIRAAIAQQPIAPATGNA